jgi:hypothetical protein
MIDAQEEDFNRLRNALQDASYESKHLTNRSEIVEYYRDTYGSGWKSKLVDALVDLTGSKRASVAREFQYDKRLGMERYKSGKITKATREKYEKLGQKLPPVKVPKDLKGKSAKISIKALLWISAKSFPKDMDVTLGPETTARLLSNVEFDPIIDEYGIEPDNVEELDLLSVDIDFI